MSERVHSSPMSEPASEQPRRSRLAAAGLLLLGFVVLVAVFAPLLAAHDPEAISGPALGRQGGEVLAGDLDGAGVGPLEAGPDAHEALSSGRSRLSDDEDHDSDGGQRHRRAVGGSPVASNRP